MPGSSAGSIAARRGGALRASGCFGFSHASSRVNYSPPNLSGYGQIKQLPVRSTDAALAKVRRTGKLKMIDTRPAEGFVRCIDYFEALQTSYAQYDEESR